MGRRAKSAAKQSTVASGLPRNTVEQLELLRNFVGETTNYTENDLTDCLRQCAFNVERAAERLMTGQYQPTKKTNGKSAFFTALSSSPVRKSTTPRVSLSAAVSAKRQSKLPSSNPKPPPSSSVKPPPSAAASTACPKSRPSMEARHDVEDLTDDRPRWLLCQRWISDAMCTIRNGRVGYKERLRLEPTMTGPPCVRFYGAAIEGRLPDNLAALLTPLLRAESTTIAIQGEALMAEDRLPTGAQVPMSLSVYLIDPRGFFQLFEQESATTTANMYFASKEKSKSKKNRLPMTEAAFGLLQWAEYGDVLEFEPPAEAKTDDSETANVELNEADFEEASVAESTAEGKELDSSLTTDWAMLLPEAEDPIGLKDGIVLRPYQRQALYWMSKREVEGESREELESQLNLLAELAADGKAKATSFPGKENGGPDIVCDCGPVIVSQAAQKLSKTVDGQVNPVNHPLWKRRFLAAPSMNEAVSFYVNELLGVATHRPPVPPTPCSGGILADSMGLGKTVMLMALILKSKSEQKMAAEGAEAVPSSTLVVAKLSLLPQWEDELTSKTNLTYLVYYGQQGSKTPSVDDLNAVDVVITTYGTIQGESKRKNQSLLNCHWLRVILDEAHCVKNQNTLASKVCCDLRAKHRWCVSGTIIQNSLDDVFGIMKFLQHEPWSIPSFWKAAVTRPLTANGDDLDNEGRAERLNNVLDRVRRLLAPLMLRRTKDSVMKDGQPILTLPPVETKRIQVDLSEGEREFYNAVLARSQELFDGFVEAGTAATSYFQIFSLLQKLRQSCDHIALTVRTRIDEEDLSSHVEQASNGKPAKKPAANSDPLGSSFLEGLLEKFRSKAASPKRKGNHEEAESVAKKPKVRRYLSQVALTLTDAIKANSSHVEEECPICLEQPRIEEAVLTPCAHIYCKDCLVGYLKEKAGKTESSPFGVICPDGECPCCNEKIDARRIVALSKSSDGSGEITSRYLTSAKPPSTATVNHEMRDTQEGNPNAMARQVLESAMGGSDSSKMTAIMAELDNIWAVDPGSKALIFSHYLGFLDLLEGKLKSQGIPYYRLDGSLNLKERMAVLEEFRTSTQSPLSPGSGSALRRGTVLLVSMSAGGEGLNLVAASSCFIVEPWWNAAREDQCVNRIHRIGQNAPIVRVRKFVVNDSVEERIIELQDRKKYMADEIYNDVGRPATVGGARLGLDDFKVIFRK